MNQTFLEAPQVELAVNEEIEVKFKELNESQLALVGGGCGDVTLS
jgi:hypothetical protein